MDQKFTGWLEATFNLSVSYLTYLYQWFQTEMQNTNTAWWASSGVDPSSRSATCRDLGFFINKHYVERSLKRLSRDQRNKLNCVGYVFLDFTEITFFWLFVTFFILIPIQI